MSGPRYGRSSLRTIPNYAKGSVVNSNVIRMLKTSCSGTTGLPNFALQKIIIFKVNVNNPRAGTNCKHR